MSLLVWLPMTKDLSDQGLGGCTITNEGTTLDNNGKLGKCYNFDGTNDRIKVSGLNNPKNITVAFWIKRNATTNTRQFLFTAWNGVSIELSAANNLFGKVQTSSGEAGGASGGTVTADSGWIHVCYTFEDKVGGKMYINGVLTGSGNTTSSIAWNVTSGYIGNYSNIYLNAKLNDFRIYDHALSPKEVEILSRGLVCHYPLNGGGRGGDNLLTNTADLTKWTIESGISVTWDADKDMYKIVDSSHTGSRWGIYKNIDISPNTSYTVTCTLEGDNCAVGFGFYDSATSFPANVMTVTNNTKKRLSYTATSGTNSTKARIYLNINCGGSTTKTAWFSLPKLEIGDHSTPWIPNSADTAYSAMGYNSTTEYDVSGYGYNGTKNGTFTYSSDTARYSVSTHIPSNGYIQHPNALGSDTMKQEWTCCAWVKLDSAVAAQQLNNFNSGNNIVHSTNSTPLLYLNGGTHDYYRYGSAAIQANVWTHIAFVFKNSTGLRNIYINGELKNGSGPNNDSTPLGIPNIVTVFRGAFAGYVSDYREYATALSASQVAELYNTAISVANNGALMGYELVEV